MKNATTAQERGRKSFYLGSDIAGSPVHNTSHDEIGTINDLVIDAESGNIRFAVVGVGGFLGIGEADVIVPWRAFQRQRDREGRELSYILDATKEQLEKAPRFDREKLEQFYPREMSEPVFRHYRITYVA